MHRIRQTEGILRAGRLEFKLYAAVEADGKGRFASKVLIVGIGDIFHSSEDGEMVIMLITRIDSGGEVVFNIRVSSKSIFSIKEY